MNITFAGITAWLSLRLAEARSRASDEADRGEIVEKVIIVAAAAVIAIGAMAAIKLAVDVKIGGIQL